MGKNRRIAKQRKAEGSRPLLTQQEHMGTDYRAYAFSWKERLRMAAVYAACSGSFAYLFYRSRAVFLLLWIFYPLYAGRRKRALILKRQERLCREFKDSIQCAAASMAAGYSIENAFREAYAEMRMQYGTGGLMTEELRYMNSCLSLNIPLEQFLYDFANRSGLEDVRSFCEVFVFAKRSGGDFIQIIHLTAARISEKNELMEAIQTEISGKKMEQKLMNLMPLFILLYVSFSFEGYLDGMYHNTLGILVMTACLAAYAGAYLLSEKIMAISV
jgi:tight adherence protein B